MKRTKPLLFPPYLGLFASLTTPLLFHRIARISFQVNISCPFTRGWGKRGHCSPSAVSVSSVTHRSLWKANSPNERGCAVAAPCVSYSAPGSSPKPSAGSVPRKWGAGHVPHPLQLPSRPSSLGDSACAKPAEAPAELGSLHPLLCLHHIKGLRNDAAWLYIQSAAVPGTQRKLFSNLRWCLDGRTSLGHFMKLLRLGSALVGTLQMSLH